MADNILENMDGMKENIVKSLLFLGILSLSACQEEIKESSDSVTYIERNGYYTTQQGGHTVYRLNEKGRLMDGRYVVGNEKNKWEEFEVKQGVLNGGYMTYHPNGNRSDFNHYKDGVLNGPAKTFFLSGKLQDSSYYKNNVKVGEITKFYESGEIKAVTKLADGKPNGTVRYDEAGTKIGEQYAEGGYMVDKSFKDGKVTKETISSEYDDFEAIKLYDDTGAMTHYFRMVEGNDKLEMIFLDENKKEVKRYNSKQHRSKMMEIMKLAEL